MRPYRGATKLPAGRLDYGEPLVQQGSAEGALQEAWVDGARAWNCYEVTVVRMGFHGYTTEGGWRIPFAALRWSYAASGGPGGQHANKTASKATVRVEIVDLGLDPAQSATLRQRFGGTIQVYASDSRSQAENKEECLRKLGERIDAALERHPKRVGTRPSARARQQRVEEKRRRGDTKRLRRQLEEE